MLHVTSTPLKSYAIPESFEIIQDEILAQNLKCFHDLYCTAYKLVLGISENSNTI
jgi:hypothetical protein